MKRTICRIRLLLMLVSCPLFGMANDLSSLVKLAPTDCAAVSADEVERILSLEIQSVAAGHPDITPMPILLTVTCAQGGFSIVARDSTTSRTSSRVRSDTPPSEGMERIIAIAAAELVLSTWEQPAERAADVPLTEESENEPLARRPSASNADATKGAHDDGISRTAQRDSLGAAFQISALWRLYLSQKVNLFGGEIGGNLYFLRLLQLHLGILPEGGRTDRALGEVSLFSVSAAISLGLYGKLFTAPLECGIGVGFRGGYGRLSGRPHTRSGGAALTGGFGGPLLRLSLTTVTRSAVGLTAEVGYAVFGLTGWVDMGRSVAIRGPWISLALDGIFFRR